MVEEIGLVVGAESGFAWIETQRKSTCGGCVARGGCGSGVLARVLGRRRTRVKALNPAGVSTGDRVVIGLEEGALVAGSLAVYLVPLIALIAGAALATALVPDRDIVAVAGGVAGLVSSFFWLTWFGNRIRIDPRYQPIILRRFRDVSDINLPVEAVSRPGECE